MDRVFNELSKTDADTRIDQTIAFEENKVPIT